MTLEEKKKAPARIVQFLRGLPKFLRGLPKRIPKGLVDHYFAIDLRSLGLARIYLATLLLYNVVRRVPGISTWLTNEGLLPNHAVLWRPSANWMFSFFFAASTREEAAVMLAICAAVFLALLVGWHTRLFHILSFVCVVSLDSRGIFLENGGDVVLNLLCAWTMFLPMGARFSVDALMRRMRERREENLEELSDRAAIAAPIVKIRSLAFLCILAQLSVIYHFNAVHKHGQTWRLGSAVHFVVYQERMVTWMGWKVRDFINPIMSRVATYFTLALEAAASILILNPFTKVKTRRAAILLLPLMHLSFAFFLDLGMFSFNMVGFFFILLTAEDWALLARWFGPREDRARTVYVDQGNPRAFALARLFSRLDAFERLHFAPPPEGAMHASGFEVEDPATGARSSGASAWAACFAALPWGRPVAFALRWRGISSVAVWAYQRFPVWRSFLARWHAQKPQASEPRNDTPYRRWLSARKVQLREGLVLLSLVVLTSQVLTENKAVPPFLKIKQPGWMQQFITYPRLFQGWSMFTPDVPTGERMIYVDALTVDGRHVDPYNEEGSRVAALPVTRIPPFMHQNEFWCDYTNRIPDNRNYWEALKVWVYNYPRRTGRKEDQIVSFELKSFEVDSPPPGEFEPKNIRHKVMLTDVYANNSH